MIQSLTIHNFALIEAAHLHFEDGFTVITGETGSGKSILLGALNLILGERADYGVIRDKSVKTVVEATFKMDGFLLESFFQTADLDFASETVIRREISAQGKSRAFINDTPVQLTLLKEITEKLIHIHSQHHTLELKNPQFQLELLDVLADTQEDLIAYQATYSRWKKLNNDLNSKKTQLAKLLQDADYNRFQLEELGLLNLATNNFQELENELNSFDRVQDVQASFSMIEQVISAERGVNDLLSSLKSSIEKVRNLNTTLHDLYERIVASLIELRDISEEASQGAEHLAVDPIRKQELSEMMDLYNRALRKHQLLNQSQLIELFQSLENQQSNTDDLEKEILFLTQEEQKKANELRIQAADLHAKRAKNAPIVAQKLQEVLVNLKLEHAQIQFQLTQNTKLDEFGGTNLALLFTPNKGLGLKPIEKAASGGELSRFMLALQLLLSQKKQLPTLVFDEIDTGVSGEVAQKIGNVLNQLGNQMQVVAITHLPQVAAKGNHHWKVQKNHDSGSTLTEVITLSSSARIEEIARLMSGENINEAALLNAKALMN
jgi:DNA repair protein RecN (Recombination protein N)